MTFDLTPEQTSQQARARELAATVLAPAAREIDAAGVIPEPVLAALAAVPVWQTDAFTAVLTLEELAVASPAAAARAGLGDGVTTADSAGLRGAPRVDEPRAQDHLALAAVALGIGRAALLEALQAARSRGDRPAGDAGDPPHWVLADAATEVDAARLLVHAVATGRRLPEAAALVQAGAAANRAVDAALRIVGADGYRPGSVLERCARDARAIWLVLGTEDQIRRGAADALLGVVAKG